SSSGGFSPTFTASALGNVTARFTDCWNRPATVTVTLTNSKPLIHDVTCTVEAGSRYVSGFVTDEHPEGIKVTLNSTQIPSINGMTVTVDATGYFTFRFASNLVGQINLSCVDWWGVQSDIVSALLA